jgi:hypothetical protein
VFSDYVRVQLQCTVVINTRAGGNVHLALRASGKEAGTTDSSAAGHVSASLVAPKADAAHASFIIPPAFGKSKPRSDLARRFIAVSIIAPHHANRTPVIGR